MTRGATPVPLRFDFIEDQGKRLHCKNTGAEGAAATQWGSTEEGRKSRVYFLNTDKNHPLTFTADAVCY